MNVMGGECSTYGGRGDVHTGFCCGTVRRRDHLEDSGVDGRVKIKWILRK
jgi:hypothetical protein